MHSRCTRRRGRLVACPGRLAVNPTAPALSVTSWQPCCVPAAAAAAELDLLSRSIVGPAGWFLPGVGLLCFGTWTCGRAVAASPAGRCRSDAAVARATCHRRPSGRQISRPRLMNPGMLPWRRCHVTAGGRETPGAVGAEAGRARAALVVRRRSPPLLGAARSRHYRRRRRRRPLPLSWHSSLR